MIYKKENFSLQRINFFLTAFFLLFVISISSVKASPRIFNCQFSESVLAQLNADETGIEVS